MANALISILEANSGLIMWSKIMLPTVISPPTPFHLKAINKPKIVLIGNKSKDSTSDLFIITVLESVLNNSPIVINNKNAITTEPKSLAAHRIIVKPFCFCMNIS